ncbi:GntR family carbon starvation induced transcriptional regulator [Mesorhizobium soli]|jgi:DNA-binding GntR family transcriptional regulator|uniref:GntR family transcriptional regulator n=1 Tax=Pseudaminobacter soli (ex Li et al. 2025) TaxID=1295366 RepID=UPI002474A23C|nr:FCD domain-containing protein [Mesorhizobium soli]MDH6231645.1 GntR family carbon starvation induced transcriptional regulator [Mesorhizobium soli]
MTLAETAYFSLRNDILHGRLIPGQPLRLEFLKKQYGLSFSPLREALNRLHAERLVVNHPPRGFTVAPVSPAEMQDVMSVRILIESEALRLSIEKGGDDWETDVVAAFHRLDLQSRRMKDAEGAADDDALMQFETRHHEFHRALLTACGSPRLLALFEQLYAETQRYRLPSFRGEGHASSARDLSVEHSNIMEAALARRADTAVDLLRVHYNRTAAYIINAS